MLSTAEIVALRGTSERDTHRFVCSSCTWEFLRDLGQTFGWHPRGTTYVTKARQKKSPLASIRHNYQPGGPEDYKQVDADDAREWVKAIQGAKHSAFLIGMIRAHAVFACAPQEALLSTLAEFVRFAGQGAFVFALSGDPAALTTEPQSPLRARPAQPPRPRTQAVH